MPALGSDPVAEEDASLEAMVHTIAFFHGFGEGVKRDAPAPPNCVEGNGIKTGNGNTTNISPKKARELTRWMRMRAATLRLHARRREIKRCRRDHLMTPENTYHGKNGDQCRQCRNASRARPRKIA